MDLLESFNLALSINCGVILLLFIFIVFVLVLSQAYVELGSHGNMFFCVFFIASCGGTVELFGTRKLVGSPFKGTNPIHEG